MAEFINTVDIVDDDVLTDSLINGTITEYRDNAITRLKMAAFRDIASLTILEIPNVTNVMEYAVVGTALPILRLPKLTSYGWGALNGNKKLELLDMGFVGSIGSSVITNNSALTALILRKQDGITSLDATSQFNGTPIASGTGYIYVPKALLSDTDATKDYRRATNWSTYASQFRAIEDYAVNGKFKVGVITYNLTAFMSSNRETWVFNSSYQTTLTAYGDNAEVSITMDGVDITTEVYNSVTGEVMIPMVVGDVVITASSEYDAPYVTYEVGGISYQTGDEDDGSGTRFRTGNIPFNPSDNR